jgi:hypothetical protein
VYTSVAETAYPSGGPELTPVFSGVRVTRSLVLYVENQSGCRYNNERCCCVSSGKIECAFHPNCYHIGMEVIYYTYMLTIETKAFISSFCFLYLLKQCQ